MFGRNYIGRNYICRNYIGHNYTGHKYTRDHARKRAQGAGDRHRLARARTARQRRPGVRHAVAGVASDARKVLGAREARHLIARAGAHARAGARGGGWPR